jgi:hypothetical protein
MSENENSMMQVSNENNSFYRHFATDAVERLNKLTRTRTESKAARAGAAKSLPLCTFGTAALFRPAEEQDFNITSFPFVLEWDDSDYGDDDETLPLPLNSSDSALTYNSSDSEEDDDEAMCCDTAKLQLSPVGATIGRRPHSLSHPPRASRAESAKACRLVRSKAFLSHLSLMDSRTPCAHD